MKTKVLVVEDSPDLVFLMCARLRIKGFDVEVAADGEEALQKVRDILPDIVLIDLGIPKINGFEVCRTMKTDQTTKDIPVIVVSAFSQEKNLEKVIDFGADSFFIKPFDFDLLIVKINALTEKK